jgi:hypothetical protein
MEYTGRCENDFNGQGLRPSHGSKSYCACARDPGARECYPGPPRDSVAQYTCIGNNPRAQKRLRFSIIFSGPESRGRRCTVHGLRIVWSRYLRAMRVKVAGLAQKLGQLEAVNMDLQSKYWANLKLLGQPCNFYAMVRARLVEVRLTGQIVWSRYQQWYGPFRHCWCTVVFYPDRG